MALCTILQMNFHSQFNLNQPPPFPTQSKPPNAPTTPAHPQRKPLQSSRLTTNTILTTVLPTEHAVLIPVMLPAAVIWRLIQITGFSTGVMRERAAVTVQLALRILTLESVVARTRMVLSLLVVIAALKQLCYFCYPSGCGLSWGLQGLAARAKCD